VTLIGLELLGDEVSVGGGAARRDAVAATIC